MHVQCGRVGIVSPDLKTHFRSNVGASNEVVNVDVENNYCSGSFSLF